MGGEDEQQWAKSKARRKGNPFLAKTTSNQQLTFQPFQALTQQQSPSSRGVSPSQVSFTPVKGEDAVEGKKQTPSGTAAKKQEKREVGERSDRKRPPALAPILDERKKKKATPQARRVINVRDVTSSLTGDWSLKSQCTLRLPYSSPSLFLPSSLSESRGIRRFLGLHVDDGLSQASGWKMDGWENIFSNCLSFQFPADPLPPPLEKAWKAAEHARVDGESRSTSTIPPTPLASSVGVGRNLLSPSTLSSAMGEKSRTEEEVMKEVAVSIRSRWLEAFRSVFSSYCQSTAGSFYLIGAAVSALFFKYTNADSECAEGVLLNVRSVKGDLVSLMVEEGIKPVEFHTAPFPTSSRADTVSSERDVATPFLLSPAEGRTFLLFNDDVAGLIELLNDLPFPEGVPRLISDCAFLHASLKPARVQARKVLVPLALHSKPRLERVGSMKSLTSHRAAAGASSRKSEEGGREVEVMEEDSQEGVGGEVGETAPASTSTVEKWQVDITGDILPSSLERISHIASNVSSDFSMSCVVDDTTSMFLVDVSERASDEVLKDDSISSPSSLPLLSSPLTPLKTSLMSCTSEPPVFYFEPKGAIKKVTKAGSMYKVETWKN